MPKRKIDEIPNMSAARREFVVGSTEFQKTPGRYQEMTHEGAVVINKHHRPTYVLLTYKEYQKLTKNRTPIKTAEAPQEDVDAVMAAEYTDDDVDTTPKD